MPINKDLGTPIELLEPLINPFWQDVIDRIRESFVKNYQFSSGNTLQSIEAPVFTIGKNSYNIKLIMPDYYQFLDEGVAGVGGWVNPMTTTGKIKQLRRNTGNFSFRDKMPPLLAIRKSMYNRGIKVQSKNKWTSMAHHEQMNQLAWAISRSIYQQGLEQTDFYSDVVNDKLINDFADNLLNELGRQVEIKITQ